MSNQVLKFKQLISGAFEGTGFYVKYGTISNMNIDTQSADYIVNHILNDPNQNWAQNMLVPAPTYKNDNKLKLELPLDYISSNQNFKNIILYVSVAGEYKPYAISEPMTETMRSKNVDIISIYITFLN